METEYFERMKHLANLCFNTEFSSDKNSENYTSENDFEIWLCTKEQEVKTDKRTIRIKQLEKELAAANENVKFYKSKNQTYQDREKSVNENLKTKGLDLDKTISKPVAATKQTKGTNFLTNVKVIEQDENEKVTAKNNVLDRLKS